VKCLLRRAYATIPFKRPLYAFIRQQLGIVPSFYQHLHFEGPFTVDIDGKHHFAMQSYHDALENELFWGGFGGTWEQMSLKVWAKLCRASEHSIIDIGANTGIYSLTAAALAPSAQIVAFEPVARIAERLAFNASLNGFPITVVCNGVSDHTGRKAIFDTVDGPNYSASLEEPLANTTSYMIDVTTIDDFLNKSDVRRPVDTVKIDVEKHEAAALRGMCQTIRADRPTILIEILNQQIGAEISELVRDNHYRLFHIDELAGLVETERLGCIGGRNWNHLLCTDERFRAAGLAELLAPPLINKHPAPHRRS
jgi:FkbM family methyltransferase